MFQPIAEWFKADMLHGGEKHDGCFSRYTHALNVFVRAWMLKCLFVHQHAVKNIGPKRAFSAIFGKTHYMNNMFFFLHKHILDVR